MDQNTGKTTETEGKFLCNWRFTTTSLNTNGECPHLYDLNNDGLLDLVTPVEAAHTFIFYRNSTSPAGATADLLPGIRDALTNSMSLELIISAEGSVLLHANDDHILDVIATQETGRTAIFVSLPDGNFTRFNDIAFGMPDDFPHHENEEYAIGDCDNDGFVDLFTAGSGGACEYCTSNQLYRSTGTGGFEQLGNPASTNRLFGASFA